MNGKIQRRWFGKTKIESNVINVLSSYIYEIKIAFKQFSGVGSRRERIKIQMIKTGQCEGWTKHGILYTGMLFVKKKE